MIGLQRKNRSSLVGAQFRRELNFTSSSVKATAIVLALWSLVLVANVEAESANPRRVVVLPQYVLDVTTGILAKDRAIVIAGDKIISVGSMPADITPQDIILRLPTFTVLPGLIDMHTHLSIEADKLGYSSFADSEIRMELRAVKNARRTLLAGFTSVRELGGAEWGDIALRDAINDGDVIGPRIAACGLQMGITGGHADDGQMFAPEYHITGEGVADGVEGVQKKVREIMKYGADVIKVMATGGVTSPKDDPQAAAYTLPELQAIVSDAHRLGRKVAAHAHGAQGILWAAQAGVDSIEHGSYINDEAIAVMKQKGTYLVPTAYLWDYEKENIDKLGWLEGMKQNYLKVAPVAFGNLEHAVRSGVKVAFGTDAAVYPHGLNAREFQVLVRLGMSPLQAIQAATINAADLMGWQTKVGTLEPGKYADLVGVEGNPLENVRVLEDVKFVMKGGVVYKSTDQQHVMLTGGNMQ